MNPPPQFYNLYENKERIEVENHLKQSEYEVEVLFHLKKPGK